MTFGMDFYSPVSWEGRLRVVGIRNSLTESQRAWNSHSETLSRKECSTAIGEGQRVGLRERGLRAEMQPWVVSSGLPALYPGGLQGTWL